MLFVCDKRHQGEKELKHPKKINRKRIDRSINSIRISSGKKMCISVRKTRRWSQKSQNSQTIPKKKSVSVCGRSISRTIRRIKPTERRKKLLLQSIQPHEKWDRKRERILLRSESAIRMHKFSLASALLWWKRWNKKYYCFHICSQEKLDEITKKVSTKKTKTHTHNNCQKFLFIKKRNNKI